MLRRLWRLALRLTPPDLRRRFADEVLATAEAIDAARPRRPRRLLRAALDALVWPWVVRRDLRSRGLTRDTGRQRLVGALGGDLRFAFRGLRHDPAFTLFVSTALALGIGANTALFGIADRLLVSGPPHVERVSEVVQFHAARDTPAGRRQHNPSFGHVTYDLLRTRARSLAAVATYTVNDAVRDRREAARPIRLGFASAGLFPLLGVTPAYGRFFTDREDDPAQAEAVVVLGDGAWRSWFGGSNDVLGRTVVLDDEPHVVIGVAPAGFTGPQFGRVDAWVPMSRLCPRVTADFRTAWTAQWLQIVARLAPGATAAAAGEEATTLFRDAWDGPRPLPPDVYLRAVGLRAADLEPESADVRLLAGLLLVSAIILVVACANVANLLLARGLRRAREVAVRAALGASRLRLVRLMLVEAALLSVGGALLGLPVAALVGEGARRAVFTDIAWGGPLIDIRLALAAIGLATAVAIVVGLAPAIRASRATFGDILKSGSPGAGHRRSPARTGLAVVQVALSAVLLIAAGLVGRSLWNIHRLDLGIDAGRVLVVTLNWPNLQSTPAGPVRDAERERRRAFHLETLPRLRALPGVEGASVAVGMPFGFRFRVPLRVAGIDELPQLGSEFPSVSAVGPGYFDTVGTAVRHGRAFDARDGAGSAAVAIVNETMASAVWPGRSPLGACLFVGRDSTTCAEVVGVAEDTHQARLREPAGMHYYVPAGQEAGFGGSVLLVRWTGDEGRVADDVRRRLTADDPALASVAIESVQARIDPQVQPWRRGTVVLVGASALALLVAGIGLYSIVSYLVADRRREIGVRLALGARPIDVGELVLRRSLVTTLVGLAAGCATGLLAGQYAEPALFGTSARDPIVYAGVVAALLSVTAMATALPLRRAQAVDPADVLRGE